MRTLECENSKPDETVPYDRLPETSLNNDNDEPPKDRFNLAFIIMVLLGMGSLFPWTFFTTAADYFRYHMYFTALHKNVK